VHAGLERGGNVRLEGVAPFGAPVFILAGKNDNATLLLPRDHRVLRDTAVATVLERLTGLALSADDLRLILSGCLVENASPADGRRWGSGWQAVTVGDRTAYLAAQQGRTVVVAADFGQWRVDYADYQGDWPRTVRVRRVDGGADITARVGELEVNTTIDPAAFAVTIPPDFDPMTIDELRSVLVIKEDW
jgi:outer membrane biogenesis lipoprotein LolB